MLQEHAAEQTNVTSMIMLGCHCPCKSLQCHVTKCVFHTAMCFAGRHLHWNAVVHIQGETPPSSNILKCLAEHKDFCNTSFNANEFAIAYASIPATVLIEGRNVQVYASTEFPIGSISAVWNNLNTVAANTPVAGKQCYPYILRTSAHGDVRRDMNTH